MVRTPQLFYRFLTSGINDAYAVRLFAANISLRQKRIYRCINVGGARITYGAAAVDCTSPIDVKGAYQPCRAAASYLL